MSDLMTRLAALRSSPAGTPDDSTVAADLARGHAALVTRRRRRAAVAGTTLAIAGIGGGSYAAAQHSSGTARADRSHHVTATRASTHRAPALQLAAYRGPQLPGFSVTRIPEGYVLQGISGSTLDIAKKGDHSDLNTFTGKLVVGVDADTPRTGTPVTVHGRPGHLRSDTGVTTLTYNDGSHDVVIQSSSDIHISGDQLVRFAEGVTVLPSVQESHG